MVFASLRAWYEARQTYDQRAISVGLHRNRVALAWKRPPSNSHNRKRQAHSRNPKSLDGRNQVIGRLAKICVQGSFFGTRRFSCSHRACSGFPTRTFPTNSRHPSSDYAGRRTPTFRRAILRRPLAHNLQLLGDECRDIVHRKMCHDIVHSLLTQHS